MARKSSDPATGYIASPEYRYWPGKGPNGEDVVMVTGKAYSETILAPEFLARCLEDGLVTSAPKPKDDEPAEAPALPGTEEGK